MVASLHSLGVNRAAMYLVTRRAGESDATVPQLSPFPHARASPARTSVGNCPSAKRGDGAPKSIGATPNSSGVTDLALGYPRGARYGAPSGQVRLADATRNHIFAL